MWMRAGTWTSLPVWSDSTIRCWIDAAALLESGDAVGPIPDKKHSTVGIRICIDTVLHCDKSRSIDSISPAGRALTTLSQRFAPRFERGFGLRIIRLRGATRPGAVDSSALEDQ